MIQFFINFQTVKCIIKKKKYTTIIRFIKNNVTIVTKP